MKFKSDIIQHDIQESYRDVTFTLLYVLMVR